MITINPADFEGYQKFLDKYRKAQKKNRLGRRLPEILRTFLKQSQAEKDLFQGLSQDQISSVESNQDGTIDVLFRDVFSPWIRLRFLNDFTEIVVTGGPAIHDYVLEDNDCNPLNWYHVFYFPAGLNSALAELAKLDPSVKRKVEIQNLIPDVEKGFLVAPSRFPISSLTKPADYDPPRNFEIREVVVPVTSLYYLLPNLRERGNRNEDIKELSHLEFAYSDPAKVPEEHYIPHKTYKIQIK